MIRPPPRSTLFPYPPLSQSRTLEEVSLPASLRLLEVARTPVEMARLTPAKINELIHACTFHGPKSRTIHAIARRVDNEFGGRSEEHTSELQSPCNLVCRLLL